MRSHYTGNRQRSESKEKERKIVVLVELIHGVPVHAVQDSKGDTTSTQMRGEKRHKRARPIKSFVYCCAENLLNAITFRNGGRFVCVQTANNFIDAVKLLLSQVGYRIKCLSAFCTVL